MTEYKPGQIWTCHAREGEPEARAVILRVETEPHAGTIVHAALRGLSIPNPSDPAKPITGIGHLPFAREAFDRSVIELAETGPAPDDLEGYRTWREAFDQKQAGVFAITVAEAIEAMEQAFNAPG